MNEREEFLPQMNKGGGSLEKGTRDIPWSEFREQFVVPWGKIEGYPDGTIGSSALREDLIGRDRPVQLLEDVRALSLSDLVNKGTVAIGLGKGNTLVERTVSHLEAEGVTNMEQLLSRPLNEDEYTALRTSGLLSYVRARLTFDLGRLPEESLLMHKQDVKPYHIFPNPSDEITARAIVNEGISSIEPKYYGQILDLYYGLRGVRKTYREIAQIFSQGSAIQVDHNNVSTYAFRGIKVLQHNGTLTKLEELYTHADDILPKNL